MQTRFRHAVRSLTPRRSAALFTLAAMAVALVTSCSSDADQVDQSDQPPPDVATLLEEATQTTRDLQSVHLNLTVQGEIPELPIESLQGDLTNTPTVAAQGTANLSLMGQRLEGVNFVVADGTLFGSLSADTWIDFGPAAETYDVAAILDPETGLANVLANFTDAEADGRESIDGVESVRITGTVSADAVNTIAPQIGATGPVPATAWIRADGDADLTQARLEPAADTSVTMTLSEWNEPVTVTKPEV